MKTGWQSVPADYEAACRENPNTNLREAKARFLEAMALAEDFGLAVEVRGCAPTDTVMTRYRLFPESQANTPPSERTYVLNDDTAYNFWLYVTGLRVRRENEATREPEPFERRTVKRKFV